MVDNTGATRGVPTRFALAQAVDVLTDGAIGEEGPDVLDAVIDDLIDAATVIDALNKVLLGFPACLPRHADPREMNDDR